MLSMRETVAYMVKDLFELNSNEKEQRNPMIKSMINEVNHTHKSLFEYTKVLVTYLPTLDTRITDANLSTAIDKAMEAVGHYSPKVVLRRDTIDGRWDMYKNIPELDKVINLFYTYYDKASVDELAKYIGRKTA